MTSKISQKLIKHLPRLTSRGVDILRDPSTNKGSAYSMRERQVLGLHGLLPPAVLKQDEQVQSVITNLYQLEDDLSRYNSMMSLQERNEKLYFKTIMSNLEYCLPLIYTPTIGDACLNYGKIMRRPRGMYITIHDKGHIRGILKNWPENNIKAVAITDGEHVLGLGDLGAYGMTIPLSIVDLYTALGGVNPQHCMPILIDIGTNNESILDSEFYIGLKQKRVGAEEYTELMDELLESLAELFGPSVFIHFEDVANHNSFRFLDRYKEKYTVFNGDIQATSSIALAGLINCTRLTGINLKDNRILFFGAGAAATGIGNILVQAMMEDGLTEGEAKSCIYMMDSKGLLSKNRLAPIEGSHKAPFIRDDLDPIDNLNDVITAVRPTVLIGVSATRGAFNRDVLSHMANLNKRPVIFALSNPPERAECNADSVYKSTDRRGIFVSGSPSSPIQTPYGEIYYPSQGNSSYVFPALAMAITSAQIKSVTPDLFVTIAKSLANMVTDEDLACGRLYPPVAKLREIAKTLAVEIISKAFASKNAIYHPEPADKMAFIEENTYDPTYDDLTPDEYEWPAFDAKSQ